MYKSFRIQNYRCFEDLTIEPLARVNLIGGKNNVGKTALLEALFLYERRHPVAGFMMYSFRGFTDVRIDDELVAELFRNFDINQTISFSSEEVIGQEKRFLEITLEPRDIQRMTISHHPSPESQVKTFSAAEVFAQEMSNPVKVLFRYYDANGNTIQTLSAYAEGGDIRFEGLTDHGKPKSSLLLVRDRQDTKQMANALSTLRRERKQGEIVRMLRILDDRIEDIEVLQRGTESIIYCDLKGEAQLMPILLMGEGVSRILEIALIISHENYEVILIDEIENGLHYSIMPKIWQDIGELAKAFNVQVFATTHSWECIEAAHQAFYEGEYDFRYHRLDRVDDVVNVVTYDQETLEGAIDIGVEIR